ncbi:MAG TPA: MFS transporter, partial [Anaerolineae bacterium]|nr:MFS transporter [Anaerolineae bacterium]
MIPNRNFGLLWLISIVTTLAVELFTITILVTVFEQTGSTLQAAGAMVARSLPAFLLGPIAGVLVDRFRRKNVLLSMDSVRLGLVASAIWLLQGDGDISVIGVYLVLAGLSSAAVFHQPARLALIPSLVKKDELVKANNFIMITRQIILAVSYTVGGWLILTVPLQQIAMGIVVLFACAIAIELLLRVPKRMDRDENADHESFRESLVSGWRYLTHHPIARPLTIMETIEHVPHGIWTGAVILAFTTQALGGDTADWGYIVTGYFIGMIVGSLAIFGFGNWLARHPGRIIVFTASLSGFLTLAFALSPTIWVATVIGAAFGPPFAIRDVAQDSLLQSSVEQGQLGRVYATRETLRSVVFMFSGLFFAWLTDSVSVRTIYL